LESSSVSGATNPRPGKVFLRVQSNKGGRKQASRPKANQGTST
jgi:hypothetical protein